MKESAEIRQKNKKKNNWIHKTKGRLRKENDQEKKYNTRGTNIALGSFLKKHNPSNAEAAFIQSTRTHRFLKII